jgi:predicted NBD/HSP70 family sugar kinase
MKMTRDSFADGELSDRERKNFAILDTIRKRGPIARTEITRLTGFNIVTVSNYVNHYIKIGLVSEEGYNTSTGGRKPMLVDLNQKSAYAIGVGFDMMGVIGVLTDLRGEIVFQIRKKYRAESGMALIQKLMDTAEELLAKSAVEREKIKGIGLAVAGIIDRENRAIRWPGPLGTRDLIVSVSLWDKFVERFHIPILIENDADCAVFGEQWLALSPEYQNVIYMYSGVACGIMIDGQVYRGASGCAGELGILNPDILDKYDWRKESYGLGRWDMELGILYNLRELQKEYSDSKILKLVNNKIEDATFITVLEAANENDILAIKLLTKAGEDLGKKVAFLVNLFNPQIVVIGGGIEKAGSVLMDSLKKIVKEWAFEEATHLLKIMPAQLAENAAPLGAASLVIKNFFEQV